MYLGEMSLVAMSQPAFRTSPPCRLKARESGTDRYNPQFENKYCILLCSGSEAGSNLRLIDFVQHSKSRFESNKEEKEGEFSHLGEMILVAMGEPAFSASPPQRLRGSTLVGAQVEPRRTRGACLGLMV